MSERGDERRGSTVPPVPGSLQNTFAGDFLGSVLAVAGIGILLFAVSGVWPPLVAVESPSMTPNIHTGDLVFVMEEQRFAGEHQVAGTGVVTTARGSEVGYTAFDSPGDVIVFERDGDARRTPVIHRASFYVTEGENWYDRARPEYLPPRASGCADLTYCPAPHGGFVTRGDFNSQYDQVGGPDALSAPVRPAWVIGTGEFRVPMLGQLRLRLGAAAPVRGVHAAALAAS